jgi:chorismate mutase
MSVPILANRRLEAAAALGYLAWAAVRPDDRATAMENDMAADPELSRLRDSIDNIDAALVHLLAERFKCTQAVGEYKATHGLPPADPGREAQQIARLRTLAQSAKLDPDFAEKFLAFIVQEVIRHHVAIRTDRAL